ncbi:MAG: RluA family pseudouridine synthase [Desulfuromonadaceae bacterium]|nr:RluA family pseudouridine synthase [Desulfuromonadaceae bacterium]
MPSPQRTPAKHQPKGLPILHEDRDIIVVVKPSGLLTMGTDRDKTRTAHTILNEYVRKGDPHSRNRVFIVHRLDRETSGTLLFARSEAAKNFLQEQWQSTEKHYFTIVHGTLVEKSGTISSYLTENSAFNVYSTPDPTCGKLSRTEYTVLKEAKGFSLLDIHLLTGRKHQIRVHLSEKGHPVVGDKKYGKASDAYGTLALHARSLSFTHPVNGRRMTFEAAVPEFFIRLVGAFQVPVI